jgi:hypothetical protein
MRKVLAVFIILIIMLSLSVVAYAAEKLIELPEVNFFINSQPVVLDDIPLGMNGRTLLPLRAALVTLGVPNDDGHIIWNSNEKSVTVINGDKKIYLKVGSKTAYLNNIPVALDASPIMYDKNQRVYIPVRFAAEAVEKEVAWDGTSKTVYIRNKDEFHNVKSILEKVDSSMNSIVRAKIETVMKLYITGQATEARFDVNIKDELDRNAKVLYSITDMPLFSKNMTFISYYAGNKEYYKDAASNKWKETILKESDFIALLKEDISLSTINSIDVMSACMQEGAGNNSDEILLKGNVYPKGLAANIKKSAGISNLEADRYYLEALIDIKTNVVKKLYVEIDGKYTASGAFSTVKAVITVTYSDINGSFEVKIPEGIM